jgi:NAD-dependent dihydropyrimidine dehydrogenase PreA subunit
MAYVIAAPCIDHSDQSCVEVCPVECIWGDLSVDRKLYVDPEGCIECGSCETACPNGAIVPAARLPSAWSEFSRIDATWFTDPDAARAAVDRLAAVA